jgi:hypothetical protein
MTTKQAPSTAAASPAAATAKAGTPRRKLITLAGVVLVLLTGVVLAVTALTRPAPAPPAAHGTAQPLTGTGAGTMTLDLLTGAATAHFSGHLSPLGADTGHDNLTVTLTGGSTFSYTGTRTFVAANGDKVFSNTTGKGTLTRTGTNSTETDTITGGTGRFAGASGTYTATISNVVVSSTAGWQTSRVTAAAHGQIRY